MHQINLINNPFDSQAPAWQDMYGRVGVRVPNEDTVFWYDMISPCGSYSILDEVCMYVDEPFNDKDAKCHYSIS